MAMETPRTLFQLLKISFFRISHAREAEAMQKHEAALIALGYLHQQEFQFTNCSWQGTNGQYFFQCMTNAFSRQPCWTCKFPATNRIEVVAPLEDMPKWKKLVADFDHS